MSQVTADTKFAPFVVIKNDQGKPVDLKPADDLAATMMVKAYVPEYDPDVMTFDEAFDLALMRDAEAADALEASIMAALDADQDEADEAAVEVVNMLLETAAMADAAEMQMVEGL